MSLIKKKFSLYGKRLLANKLSKNNMKTLYIHAGMPKCGSSALQVFFAKNVHNLVGEGVDYFNLEDLAGAESGAITSGNGALLSRSMLGENHEVFYDDGGNAYKNLIEAVRLSKLEIGLISSEFFAVVPFKTLEKLKLDLANIGVEVKFIYYVRRQDQFLMSSYMQRVKRHGFTGMPEDFIESNFKNIHFLKYFGYANELESYLGEGNVIPMSYEDTKQHVNGLVGHFMNRILGKNADWVSVDPVVNVSPSPVELKMMIVANQFGARPKLSDFLVQDSVTSGRGGKFKEHAILAPALLDEVMSYFNEQNQKFSEKYGITFGQVRAKEYLNLRELEVDHETMTSVLMGLIVRLDRRVALLEGKKK